MEIFLFTDWASRWNPWKSWGWYIAYNKDKEVVLSWSKYFWIKTNNQSEYMALIEGIKACFEHKPSKINLYLDSQLIVRQLNREYKVKNPDMKMLYSEVTTLLKWAKWTANHVARELNKDADSLANKWIDDYF